MDDEAEPDRMSSPQRPRISDLCDDEREMLREFAAQLRARPVRNVVAREALDRAAEQLDQAAEIPRN